MGRESRWVSHECHRKRGSYWRHDRKTWIFGDVDFSCGEGLLKREGSFFGSQEGKGWGCVSRNQEKMAQEMQFKQKKERQRGLGKNVEVLVTLSFTVSGPSMKSAHEQSTFAALCTIIKCSGNLKMPHCKTCELIYVPSAQGMKLLS